MREMRDAYSDTPFLITMNYRVFKEIQVQGMKRGTRKGNGVEER